MINSAKTQELLRQHLQRAGQVAAAAPAAVSGDPEVMALLQRDYDRKYGVASDWDEPLDDVDLGYPGAAAEGALGAQEHLQALEGTLDHQGPLYAGGARELEYEEAVAARLAELARRYPGQPMQALLALAMG